MPPIETKIKAQKTRVREIDADYPALDNTNADVRLVGGSNCLTPFPEFTSGSRLDMFRSHLSQFLVLDTCEPPQIFTGKEVDAGRYEMNGDADRRDQDGMIIAVIPKYTMSATNRNPKWTVIWRGERDGLIHYFDIETHSKWADGFGYKNVLENRNLLVPNGLLPRDVTFQHSPAKDGDTYSFGVNVNCAYMTHLDTIEDSMAISESLADKFSSLEIKTVRIPVKIDEHPLNIYGTSEEPKFLPDIGECVKDDGILCAFRRVSTESYAADMGAEAVRQVDSNHDSIVKVPCGATVVDLDFYTAPKKENIPWSVFGQIERYISSIKIYWEEILKVYNEAKRSGYPISDRFNNLVTTAMHHTLAHGGRVQGIHTRKSKFINRLDQPVDFLDIEVTYAVKRKVTCGFKITDRHGTKGIIGRIVPDEEMPIDDFGIRADLTVNPTSTISRMNIGQINEPAINRASEFVRRRIESMYDPKNPQETMDVLLDYYGDINARYAEIVRDLKNTPQKMRAHIEDAITDGIRLWIPPFLSTMHDIDELKRNLAVVEQTDPSRAQEIRDTLGFKDKLDSPGNYQQNIFMLLKEKWGVKMSPVTYVSKSGDGKPDRIVRTKNNVSIGSKYMMILCKVPKAYAPGVSHVSHHGIPIKPPIAADRDHTALLKKPIRFGEDEFRTMICDVGSDVLYRLTSMQSSAPEVVSEVCRAIFDSENPTSIENFGFTPHQLVEANAVTNLLNHMVATIGIDLVSSRTHPEDYPDFMIEPFGQIDSGDSSGDDMDDNEEEDDDD